MQHLREGNAYPITPDGRYFVVRSRLWRCSNPALSPEKRAALVKDLMAARRAVSHAKTGEADGHAMSRARAAVDKAKQSLGERGPVWWSDGAPDYNRHLATNTPYADWYRALNSFNSP